MLLRTTQTSFETTSSPCNSKAVGYVDSSYYFIQMIQSCAKSIRLLDVTMVHFLHFSLPEVETVLSSKSYFEKHNHKQECIPVGCVPSAAVAVSPGGCLLPGVVVSQHALRQTPPPVDRLTAATA